MHVILRRNQDKLLRQGYPWVFANQIHRLDGTPSTGDVVQIHNAEGHVYGQGLYHADSLIAVRFLTSDISAVIDEAFFFKRLEKALHFREAAFPDERHYRLVFSESDGFPGTIIDRYGDVLTWTTLSYGMEQRADLILNAVEQLIKPRAIVERNDTWLRTKDGLAERKSTLRGSYDQQVEIVENGIRMEVDVLNGPKTGYFIDHRFHRLAIRRFAANHDVLDVFCADGGFSLNAASAGARTVHALDISEASLNRMRHNAAVNGLEHLVTGEQGNALNRLEDLVDEGRSYGLVILDPPGFAKSKRNVDVATSAYQRVNINALQLLEPGGVLATASCSQALKEKDFLKIIHYAARKTGKQLRLLYRGSQPPDHPVLEAMPETNYLKFFIFQTMTDELPSGPS